MALWLKLAHGSGAIAFGIKDGGFSFFLLIFYNQVLGMEASTVSYALLIALLVDAFCDPIIGNLSDRTYTRWGRRLPWLYVAPIPLAIAWTLLWTPPGGGAPSFWGLVGMAVSVRLLLSCCEVPQLALVPELTGDYDERTTLFRWRFLFGWLGGLLMMVLAYTVFMPGADGLLRPDGYAAYGIAGALLMALAVMGSAAGQHREVARLPAVKPPPFTARNMFGEIVEAFSERAFLIWSVGAMAAYVAQGMTFSIANYLNLFVWEFGRPALTAYPAILFFSVVLMFFLVSPMHRRFGKPRSAAIAVICSAGIMLIPFALYLVRLWPEPGGLASTLLFFGFLLCANTMGIIAMISANSMVAEIVEAFQERTGRRAEGSFYAGNWFIQKCATGGGILITGQIISLSGLSTDAEPGTIPQATLDSMILLYGGGALAMALIAAFWLHRFPIDRSAHEARLSALDSFVRADPDHRSVGP
ncbi:sugar transporter [Altererythrobacter halimionae]|uniref:Sugar transporter n=1 Tax=Alteriqipengyuania halimionae TaxID=1926630 RepID=A0A6I4TXS9_9SPHN|nr:sugar transporter [Alteriqipengyuania halimionae]